MSYTVNLPESPGRDLLMRLEYLDHQPDGAGLHEHYRQSRDASAYFLILLANYVVEDWHTIEVLNDFGNCKHNAVDVTTEKTP